MKTEAASFEGCGRPALDQKMSQAPKQLAAQAQASYERTVRDWKAASPKKDTGASMTAERA
jgi:hypothetical protein